MRFMDEGSLDVVSMDVVDCTGSDLFEQVDSTVGNDWCFAERLEEVPALISRVGCDVDAKWYASSETAGVKMTRSKTVDGPVEVH